jgi:mRNA interferase HigB
MQSLALSHFEIYNHYIRKIIMHIITQKRIVEAKERYPQTANALDGWLRIIKKNRFNCFAELKKSFNSIDKVADLYIFNIGGNKLRLIVNIDFYRQRVYIRHILTHADYDRSNWKQWRALCSIN